MIPHILHRTVPEHTTDEVEYWWQIACGLHPSWDCRTYRDPLDPEDFPITSPHWNLCKSGAQLAGLVRLELVLNHGGTYLDSDVELFRSLEPLCQFPAWAAWEDASTVPDAVFGAVAGHPAIRACLDEAIRRIQTDSDDWRTGNGAWSTGPGVFTTILPRCLDVVLLTPESFYPVHYTDKHLTRTHRPGPATFGIHHWMASWLSAPAI